MFEPIGNIVRRRKKQFCFSQEIKAIEVFQVWQEAIEEIFNKEISQKCEPVSFKDGLLKIKTENSVLSQELQLRRDEIRNTINRKLKQDLVQKILFQL